MARVVHRTLGERQAQCLHDYSRFAAGDDVAVIGDNEQIAALQELAQPDSAAISVDQKGDGLGG